MKNVEKDVLHRREERRMGMRDRRGWWMWLRWQPRWRPAINQRIGDHPLPIYRKRLVEVTASLEASNQPEDRRPSFGELQKEVGGVIEALLKRWSSEGLCVEWRNGIKHLGFAPQISYHWPKKRSLANTVCKLHFIETTRVSVCLEGSKWRTSEIRM